MDIQLLSSNWKILQARLQAGKNQERGATNGATKPPTNGTTNHLAKKQHAPPPAKQLKRKASDAHKVKPGGNPATKRQKLTTKPTGASEPGSKMGAAVSALPTASYSLNQPPIDQTSNLDEVASLDAADEAAPATIPAPIASTVQAGKYVGLDCEMVGTHSMTPLSIPAHKQNDSSKPEYSILARVSLVTYALEPLYDAYVLPPPGVTICDYRTPYSGITPWHLTPNNPTTAPKPFHVVQKEVDKLLKDRTLVGHALKNDLEILGLSHPRKDIRDTARHPPFRALSATMGKDGKLGKGRTPSLKKLSLEVLGWNIQGDEKKGHSSIEDAKAAMALFRKEKAGFDKEFVKMYGRNAAMSRTTAGSGAKAGKGRGVVLDKIVDDEDEDIDGLMEDGGLDEEDDDEDAEEGKEEGTAPANGRLQKRKGKRKKRTKR